MSERTYDVVVIGAGNGGLAAAATTAQKGMKTLLIEQHTLPGGYASSFVRGRFEFEPSLHELCDVGKEGEWGACGTFFKDLGLDIEWVPVPEAYRMVITDKDEKLDVKMPFGLNEYIDKMEEYVPGSRESVTNFFDLCQEVLDAIGYLGASKGNPDKKVLTSKYSNFLKTASYSVDQVEKALKIPKKARDILNAYWCYLGTDTEKLGFTIYGAMMIKFLLLGAYIPKMRSHEISLAFEKAIRDFGGDVIYGTKVEKILVENGSVVGVTTDKGEKINTKHVICNAPRHVAFGNMVEGADEIKEKANREFNSRKVGGKGYVAYFGLNKTAKELGLTDYSYFIYPTVDNKKLYNSMFERGNNPMQAIVCLNNAIPDCSPPGTSMLTVTTLYKDGAWDDVNETNYVQVKNKIAKDIVRNIESALNVKISDAIEEYSVASPQTFARYACAYDGSIYGYESETWDSLLPRLLMMKDDLYINGLRFVGGFAFRCHGYSSGYMSGNTIGLLTYKDSLEEK
ncbi:MAG: FAD-dependent oxidoreductase [Clostridia bacterium]|nr:FAD-dependent oxidoreductase [Clostridia bacterium]MDD3092964.1 FAD-dependent oxidoreductase [Clostridia bacterium]MDD3971954.1 FAD-dependent oxidoreductase [Clostridia bacterium]MDD4542319.1 FAD-dependent oxidoreductase [Clostridia bacterium]